MQRAKERYRDPESRRQYWKRKYQENPEQKKEYEKKKYQKNPERTRECEKKSYNPQRKRKYERNKNKENPEPKRKHEINKYEENPEPKKKKKWKKEPKREYEENKCKKNLEPTQENHKKMHKKNKNCLNEVAKFCQQIRQDRYFIWTVCHWCLYKQSVRLFEHEKYHILNAEWDHLMKIYICYTCHKHLCRNEIPSQAVFNKMSLDPISDELKDLKKLRKNLNFSENNI